MGRSPCCDKNGLKKGPWTPEEDQKLINYIKKNGHGSWRTLPKNAGLSRCGKSCRLRWTNYLRPDIKRGRFSFEEEETIIQLHSILGNKWSAIAAQLPGRTDNEIKNYWNTHIRKRLHRMGIDPVTHFPRLDLLDISSLLSPMLYNKPGQLDLSGLLAIEPIVSSELLRFASNLLQQNANFAAQVVQEDVVSSYNQLQNLIFNSQNVGLDCRDYNVCDFGDNFVPVDSGVGYMDQLVVQDLVQHGDQDLDFQIPCNFTHDSVMSTPTSSLTLNNSNCSGEHDQDSYCSGDAELFNFEIPDLLDVSDFL